MIKNALRVAGVIALADIMLQHSDKLTNFLLSFSKNKEKKEINRCNYCGGKHLDETCMTEIPIRSLVRIYR